jgi:hypothetical protein
MKVKSLLYIKQIAKIRVLATRCCGTIIHFGGTISGRLSHLERRACQNILHFVLYVKNGQ